MGRVLAPLGCIFIRWVVCKCNAPVPRFTFSRVWGKRGFEGLMLRLHCIMHRRWPDALESSFYHDPTHPCSWSLRLHTPGLLIS
ncbi:hypothetical protein F4775DRAFT_333401 [Biscogniauxia sp. FL1348]|nr:hypothetical protein F4775DRAFT_333401 [Biscogniauxia sp. FL1348]